MGATVVGMIVVSAVANMSLEKSRAQACADAVALALVAHTRASVQPLLDALNVRVLSIVRDGAAMLVEVDTPWGPSRATATIGG